MGTQFFPTTGLREFLPSVDNTRRFWALTPEGRDLKARIDECAATGHVLYLTAGTYHVFESKEFSLRYVLTPTVTKLTATLRQLWEKGA